MEKKNKILVYLFSIAIVLVIILISVIIISNKESTSQNKTFENSADKQVFNSSSVESPITNDSDEINKSSSNEDESKSEEKAKDEETHDKAGILISHEEIMLLPTEGKAWENLLSYANKEIGFPDIEDQSSDDNIIIFAKALVYARTGEKKYLDDVLSSLDYISNQSAYNSSALAMGRELSAYVSSADIINLKSIEPELDSRFKLRIKELINTELEIGGPKTLIECSEKRPNNWGTHCMATRLSVAVYLDDKEGIERVSKLFHGWVGDRNSYSDFKYGDDLSWQCDETKPVGINPVGCLKDGIDISGAQPEEMRRAGEFSWPPVYTNYVWGGLQGVVETAHVLSRQGYDSWNWGDKAILRAVDFLYRTDQEFGGWWAKGDDEWISHLINHAYDSSFPEINDGARPGKNIGFTDWMF